MAEIGLVIHIQQNLLQLEIPRSKACGGCKACVPLNGKESMTTFALNLCNAHIGDQVEIEPGQPRQLSSALFLYGIPLAVFLCSLFLLTQFFNELAAFLLSCLTLGITYTLLYFIFKHVDHSPYTHRAIRIISSPETSNNTDFL